MVDLKKVTAAVAPIQASNVPIGAIAPRIAAKQAHPLDGIRQKEAQLRSELAALAREFNLAQRRNVKVVQPPETFWCHWHSCQGFIDPQGGRRGACNICKRQVDIMSDSAIVPRHQLPVHVVVPEAEAEVIGLQKKITAKEREIEQHKRDSAAIEQEFRAQSFGNQDVGRPTEYLPTWR
jgi:hypothetical protein